MKKPATVLRTVKLYARYCPELREVVEFQRFKKDLAQCDDGEVVLELKGYYIPKRAANYRRQT